MRTTSLCGQLIVLALLVPAALPAQHVRGALSGFAFGVGGDLQEWGDALVEARGLALMAAADLTKWSGPLAARITLTYFSRGGSEANTQQYGVGLDLKYIPFRGRVRPYVLSGAAAYRVSARLPEGTTPLPSDDDRLQILRRTGPAVTAGGGVLVRAPYATWVFVEGRYTRFGAPIGVRESYAPMMVGVRF